MDNEIVVKRKPKRLGLIIFIAVLVLLLIGGTMLIVGISSLAKGGQVKVKTNSTLVLKLDKPIQEMPADPFAMQFFGAKVYQFAEIHDAIKRAKDDERIKSLLIVPTMTPISFAKAQELKKDIEEFKKSKKPVYAYFDVTGNTGYYLAASADKIYAPPTAMLFLSGVYAEMPFLRDTLEKIKIEPQLYHIGDYKSASDMFMRNNMSDAQKEAMDAILDTFYRNLVKGICENGRFTEEEAKVIIDKGMQTGDFLKESKLVDEFLYPDDIDEILKKANGSKDDLNKIEIGAYVRDKRAIFDGKAKNSIAVVIASGEIVDSGKGDTIVPERVNKLLDKAQNDKDVKAVVFRVDSPGGSGLASDVIWDKVNKVRKSKPVIVSMSSVAGSGGYYISMGSDGIVAEPTTITGSIGVITGKFVIRGITDWAGVGWGMMKRGENADLFSELQKFTPEQEKIIVGHMESFYKDFVTKAAQGRNMTYDEVHKIAQGRIWSGEDAIKIGLVDRLGGLDEAIEFAKEKAKIPAKEKVNIKYYPRQKTIFESFMEMSGEEVANVVLKTYFPKIYDNYAKEATLLKMIEKEPILYYVPEEVHCN
ncbi:MAG: signal peptide peptidase SppA [Acidobacteria bacterium]|nr:signal peptide peptidase SppA [Acidobacteriota bacterium]